MGPNKKIAVQKKATHACVTAVYRFLKVVLKKSSMKKYDENSMQLCVEHPDYISKGILLLLIDKMFIRSCAND